MTTFNQQQAAEFLGVSPRTLEGWRQRGGGPVFHKLGSRVTYEESDLLVFKSAGRRTSTSDPGPSQSAAAP